MNSKSFRFKDGRIYQSTHVSSWIISVQNIQKRHLFRINSLIFYITLQENIENNQDNDVIPGPSNSLHNEEYSSIERRQQITLGQVVSFAVCSSQNQPKAICNNGNSGHSCQGTSFCVFIVVSLSRYFLRFVFVIDVS